MKLRTYLIPIFTAVLVVLAGCDQDFEDINTNPYAISRLDPPLLFANAVRQTHPGHWEGESTIVQHFVNAFNLGATAGPNFNTDADGFNTPKWNGNYPNTIKLLVKAIELARQEPGRTNLIAMMRIWKAYTFMTMVDTYADVPYVEAGKGDYGIFTPRYDDDAVIYDSIYNELKSATDALTATGEFVSADLFYAYKFTAPATRVAQQTEQWKRLGNTILLRLGMRYSKSNPTLAQARVSEAVTRGVIQSNAEDAFIQHSSNYNTPSNVSIRGVNPYFYYMAEPFVDQLKNTNDPRAKFIVASYANPSAAAAADAVPDVTLANQFGFPVGYDNITVQVKPGYRGPKGSGLNYSQINYSVLASATAPLYFITNSQTKFLLAEATKRNWINSQGTVEELYEAGIRASMDQWVNYPNGAAISSTDQDAYINQAGVEYDDAIGFEQIALQYWISNVNNGGEAWANFRRTGLPNLSPNMYGGGLPGGGFIRRLPYPNTEAGQNEVNYNQAAAAIGGDNFTSRVFWDVP